MDGAKARGRGEEKMQCFSPTQQSKTRASLPAPERPARYLLASRVGVLFVVATAIRGWLLCCSSAVATLNLR